MTNAALHPLSASAILWIPPGRAVVEAGAPGGHMSIGEAASEPSPEAGWEPVLMGLVEKGGLKGAAAALFSALLALGLLVWLGISALSGSGLIAAALGGGLMAALCTGLVVALLGSQRRMARAQGRLWSMATLDPLTGAHNRAGAELVGQGMISEAAAGKGGLGLILVDADHFKRINDTMGHGVGDEVLRGLVLRLKGALRAGDVVARYGGEEFLILIEGCDEGELAALAERLRAAVAGSPLCTSAGPVGLTISLGAALYRGEEALEALVRRADVALYSSKRGGRNRVSLAVASPEPLWH